MSNSSEVIPSRNYFLQDTSQLEVGLVPTSYPETREPYWNGLVNASPDTQTSAIYRIRRGVKTSKAVVAQRCAPAQLC